MPIGSSLTPFKSLERDRTNFVAGLCRGENQQNTAKVSRSYLCQSGVVFTSSQLFRDPYRASIDRFRYIPVGEILETFLRDAIAGQAREGEIGSEIGMLVDAGWDR